MGNVISSPYPDVEIPLVALTDFVLGPAQEYGERPALVDGPSGRVYTYAELIDRIERCAAGLVKRGLEPGEIVGIYAPNDPDYAVAFYGVLAAGGTNTTVNALFTSAELARQLRDAEARFLITAPPLLDRALDAAREARIEETFVFGEEAGATPFESLLENGTPPELALNPDEHVASLPYSSGTTGLPKGVMLTHRNLVANLCQIARLWELPPDDECVIAVLPFFHIYGQTVLLHHCLRFGATVVTMPRFDLEQYLSLSQQHRATVGWIVPPMALALAKHPIVDEYELSSLRWLVSGAAPLDAELQLSVAERLGCVFMQAYGLTETSPATHTWAPDAEIATGAIGPLIPSTEARLVDPASGKDVPPGDRGEIWIRGPQVMKGYLGNPEATSLTIDADGWLRSGDIAVVSEDGVFRIVDRLKELIKYKGYQVPPAELEGVLLTHPAVADACVIPVADEEAGEIPKAYIVPKADVELTPDDIMGFVAAQVAPHKRIRECEFVDEIPKSPSGKLLRRVLVEREHAVRGGRENSSDEFSSPYGS